MSKVIELTGRTEILAAIYSSDFLPSAILSEKPDAHGTEPFCLHCLRRENVTFFEQFASGYKKSQGKKVGPETDEEVKAWLVPFCEDYYEQGHQCIGCHDTDDEHRIETSEKSCRKTTEDCA